MSNKLTDDPRVGERDRTRFVELNKQFFKLLYPYSYWVGIQMKKLLAEQGHEWAVMTEWDADEGELVWASEEEKEEYFSKEENGKDYGHWDISHLAEEGWTTSNSGRTKYAIHEAAGDTWEIVIEDTETGMEFGAGGVNVKSLSTTISLREDAHWRVVAQTANGFFGYGLGWVQRLTS